MDNAEVMAETSIGTWEKLFASVLTLPILSTVSNPELLTEVIVALTRSSTPSFPPRVSPNSSKISDLMLKTTTTTTTTETTTTTTKIVKFHWTVLGSTPMTIISTRFQDMSTTSRFILLPLPPPWPVATMESLSWVSSQVPIAMPTTFCLPQTNMTTSTNTLNLTLDVLKFMPLAMATMLMLMLMPMPMTTT